MARRLPEQSLSAAKKRPGQRELKGRQQSVWPPITNIDAPLDGCCEVPSGCIDF